MLASLILGCAATFWTCVRPEPAAPAPHQPFDLVYEGRWLDTTVPKRIISADVDGFDIRVLASTDARPGQLFQQAVTPFSLRVPAAAFAPDGLAAGTYRILVEVDRDAPQRYRYDAAFSLLDVGGASIVPRSGRWRALEPPPDDAPGAAAPRDSGIRIFVDARPHAVHVTAVGAQETTAVVGASSITFARPGWAEAWLPLAPRHVEGRLLMPITTRYMDGRPLDRRQIPGDTIDIAIEWLDPRNGVLYLRSRVPAAPITPLALVFDDGLHAADLARRWLVTQVRGESVLSASILALEEVERTETAWNYHDARSGTALRCTAVRLAQSACMLLDARRGTRASLVCGADGCDGQDSRGAKVTLTRWD